MALVLVMLLGLCACGPTATGVSDSPSVEPSQNNQDLIQEKQESNGIIPDYAVMADESRKSTANTDERLESLTIIQKFDLTDVGPTGLYRAEKTIAITGPVYEALFRRTDVEDWVGVLAKDWTLTDEYLDVTIYDYIHDLDGNNITADDIVFSYDIYLESGLQQQWTISSYEKTGDYSVRFNFDSPQTGTSFTYSFCQVGIISEKAYNDHNKMITEACGTGPYKVTDFVASAYVEIEATDDYWQTPELTDEFAKANVQKLRVNIVSEAAQQLIALQNGTSAYCALDSTTINDFLEGGKYAGQYALYSHLDGETYGLLANCSEDSIMKDINMRLACWYAIDTAAIAKMLGASMYMTCTVNVSRASSDYNSEWDDIEGYHTTVDYDLVEEYLEQAGYKGETVVILCEEHDTKKTIAEAAANMLEAAGINADVQVRAYALMDTEMADSANWDLYLSSGGSSGHSVDRLYTNFSVNAGKVEGYPYNFEVDEEFQEKLVACYSSAGYSEELTDEIIRYLLDYAYELSICYGQTVTAYQPIFASLQLRYGENKVMVTACDYYLD